MSHDALATGKFRSLRIAWMVTWGMLAVLLCVLWCRSHWYLDVLTKVNSAKIQTTIGSQLDGIYFVRFNAETAYKGTGNPYSSHGWRYKSLYPSYGHEGWRFAWKSSRDIHIAVPHWFVALIAALIASAVRFGTRFSVRDLLIAMTAVAVLFGLAISLAAE